MLLCTSRLCSNERAAASTHGDGQCIDQGGQPHTMPAAQPFHEAVLVYVLGLALLLARLWPAPVMLLAHPTLRYPPPLRPPILGA